jgi:hypothetical protein
VSSGDGAPVIKPIVLREPKVLCRVDERRGWMHRRLLTVITVTLAVAVILSLPQTSAGEPACIPSPGGPAVEVSQGCPSPAPPYCLAPRLVSPLANALSFTCRVLSCAAALPFRGFDCLIERCCPMMCPPGQVCPPPRVVVPPQPRICPSGRPEKCPLL